MIDSEDIPEYLIWQIYIDHEPYDHYDMNMHLLQSAHILQADAVNWDGISSYLSYFQVMVF